MAQARRSSGSSSSSGSGSRGSGAKRSSRSSGSGGSARTSASSRKSTSSPSRKSTSSRKSSTSRKSTSSRSGTSRRSAPSRGPAAAASAAAAAVDPALDAAAQRLRKLNEQIIEAGKTAGGGALASYEKVLKTIAGTLERGPGSSDVEWISSLATAQAKFIRDVTAAWTKAARDMLK